MAQRNSTNTMLGITAHFRRQDGKSVDPPVSTFDRSGYTYSGTGITDRQLRYTRRSLEENLMHLMDGFLWMSTPQRHDYWSSIYRGEAELLPEDRDYIEWLLVEYRDGLR
jgi:hypothetical protein